MIMIHSAHHVSAVVYKMFSIMGLNEGENNNNIALGELSV